MSDNKQTKIILALKRLLKNKDFTVFFVFFVVSSLIWLLNKLSEEYTIQYTCSYECTNVPTNYFISPDDVKGINVFVRSDGFNLIKLKFSRQPLLTVNIGRLNNYRRNNEFGVYFVPARHFSDISSIVPDGVHLTEISEDTVFIKLLSKRHKCVPVKPVLNVTLDKQHTYSSPVIVEPDSVWVNGANNIIDTLQYIRLKPFTKHNLRDSLSVTLNFDVSDKINVSALNATVHLNVEPAMEREVEVPVTAINLPQEYGFKSFPIAVNVVSKVGFSSFEQINASMFDAYVDFDGVKFNQLPTKLKVKVQCKTDKVKSFSYSPLFVEYLLERKR